MIIRPAFRVELKMHVRRADGSREVVWLPINESFDGQTVVKALQEATEAGCNEVGRIARRPAYDLISVLGADYCVVNVRFVRTDVEDEDNEK